MTKPTRDPVAGGVAALRRLTLEDTSAGDLTRARLVAGLDHRRHRPWLSKKTGLLMLLPLVASTALAATVIRHTVWTTPVAATPQPRPSTRPRPPARPAPAAVAEQTADEAAPRQASPAPAAATEQPAAAPRSVREPDADLNAYGVAHRAHFAARDSARALRLWNAYLRDFPHGRFVPEATYNRAIALLHLDRRREAITALRPLAAGRFDGYRQREAQALLESLQRE